MSPPLAHVIAAAATAAGVLVAWPADGLACQCLLRKDWQGPADVHAYEMQHGSHPIWGCVRTVGNGRKVNDSAWAEVSATLTTGAKGRQRQVRVHFIGCGEEVLDMINYLKLARRSHEPIVFYARSAETRSQAASACAHPAVVAKWNIDTMRQFRVLHAADAPKC